EACTGTRPATVGPQEEYAPVLKSAAKSRAVSFPSCPQPPRSRIRVGCRFVVDIIDSVLEYTMRTGCPSFQAASATKGCTDKSSFEPKPPPTAVGIILTCSGAIPRIAAMSLRSIGRLSASLNLDLIAHAARESCLRLDVGE